MLRLIRPTLLCLCLAAPMACAQPAPPPIAPAAPVEAATSPVAEPAPLMPGSPEFLKLLPQQQQEAIMKYSQQEGMRIMRLSPEERRMEMQRMREQLVKQNLTRAGFAQPELQDAVLEFLRAQDKARDDVRRAARAASQAIQPKAAPQRGAAVGERELMGLINDYLAATQAEKFRREEAENALDEKINWSANPRLQAVLLLNGYIGEAAFYTGDSMMGLMAMATLQ